VAGERSWWGRARVRSCWAANGRKVTEWIAGLLVDPSRGRRLAGVRRGRRGHGRCRSPRQLPADFGISDRAGPPCLCSGAGAIGEGIRHEAAPGQRGPYAGAEAQPRRLEWSGLCCGGDRRAAVSTLGEGTAGNGNCRACSASARSSPRLAAYSGGCQKARSGSASRWGALSRVVPARLSHRGIARRLYSLASPRRTGCEAFR
jgi:hypothetical protein